MLICTLIVFPNYWNYAVAKECTQCCAWERSCRGRGHGRGDVNQQVNNEEVNQSNGEVEGAEENSIVVAAPVGGGANAPVQAMTFTRWMSMRLDTFDGSRMATDAADRPRTRWSGDGSWA